MYKDKRYDKVYYNLKAGNIKSFKEIFKYIPIEVAAVDMGISDRTLGRRFKKLENVTTNEIFELSTRINPSIETYNHIVKLIIEEWQKKTGDIIQ